MARRGGAGRVTVGVVAGLMASSLTLLAPSTGSAGAAAAATNGASPYGTTVPSPVCIPRRTPVPSGPATFVRQSTVPNTGGRVLDIVLDAPAMNGPTHIDVLLPRGYDPSGATRYPVLYLLHGAGGSYRDWVGQGVESDIDYTSVADGLRPFITVMPDGGAWGYYSDWYGTDIGQASSTPPPAYATYDIDELIPWIDGHFPTVATRAGRAIAGLSMGGFGAMSLAAQNPDLFTAAGSFSGAVDTDIDYPIGGAALNLLSSAFTHGLPSQCVWGDPVTQGVLWHGADPTYLASNLSNTWLFVASGNGKPGIYDTPGTAATAVDGGIESFVYSMNQNFIGALDAAHISYNKYFYGNGTHSWGYWLRDLAHFLPEMEFAFVTTSPSLGGMPFTYRTIHQSFTEFGYAFSVRHPAAAFTYLNGVTSAGLSVTGTGDLSVVTPATYVPGGSYLVSIATSGSGHPGTSRLTERADPSGKLAFTVDLGGPNSVQQTSFANPPASFGRAQVTISTGPG
ncbi:MAG TPA: alpha/beta hydrolase family protein [Acidimicrobiales bacterium]